MSQLANHVVLDLSTGESSTVAPTPEEQAASDANAAALVATIADEGTKRSAVVNVAQSAVGINITALTATQVRGLVAVLLFRAGAIDKAGVVLPLNQWL